MANPTTNFGWQMPQNTDLVKDLPADFEVFGQAVDTDLADLKGGTTGQVLSKTSNTDLDFTWTTPNVGDITEVQAGTGISVASGTGPIPVITNTVATEFDAKGDLIVGTGADTFDRLAVGTDGFTLVADSAETTGLKWQAPASGGGMTLLSTTTLSGSSTTISSISGAYVDLVIYIYGITSSNADYVQIKPNGSSSLATYMATKQDGVVNTERGTSIYSNSTEYFINSSGGNNAFTLQINNYASTSARKPFTHHYIYEDSAASTVRGGFQIGGLATNSAISSLEISRNSGTFSTGTVLIYGVK